MKNKKVLIILIITMLVMILLLSIAFAVLSNKEKEETVAKLSEEEITEVKIKKESNMTERDRIDYYFTNFINYIEKRDYKKAYDLLYPDFNRKITRHTKRKKQFEKTEEELEPESDVARMLQLLG